MSPTTRDHVLQLPLYLSVLRVIQIVLAVILLGLAAYTLSVLVYPGLSLTLFTSLATLITTIYILITAEFYPITYNYWPALGLDIFLVVFWLVSFALTASEAKHYYQVSPYEDGCFRKLLRRQECFHTTSSSTYRDVLKAIAVFGAFEFVLFTATLAFTGVYLHRHRKAGGHCIPSPLVSNIEMRSGAAPSSQVPPV